jgi:integrase
MGVYLRSDNRQNRKVWWISYMKAGSQHRESTGSTNKRVAQTLLELRKTQVIEERWNLPRSKTPRFGLRALEFLKSKNHEKTRSRYQSSINNLLRHFGENIHLSDMTPESIFAFQQKRLAEGAGKATVNRDIATLSALMSQSKRMRLISNNPCLDVGKLNERRDRRQAKPLSYDEEARIKQFSSKWLSVLITLLVETGLRVRKEALPLKWSDVLLDSEPACLHVRESKSISGIRTVWLTDHCKKTLVEWRKTVEPDYSPYVFPSSRAADTHITDYNDAWERAAKQAGILGKRPYDLRATFASRANGCKASGLTVAHLLGHASTQILPTYVKPLDENTKAVIEALDVARTLRNTSVRSLQ